MSTTTDSFSWFTSTHSGIRHLSTASNLSTGGTKDNANLEIALAKVATAVSRLHRCGETFVLKSEAFWIFCAGSWTRERYEEEVKKAASGTSYAAIASENIYNPPAKAKGMVSVEEDLRLALAEVLDAVRILRRGWRDGDERDAEALMEAVEGSGIWEGRRHITWSTG